MVTVREERSLLLLALLSTFTIHFHLFSYSPLIPYIVSEMQVTYAEAGAVVGIALLAIVITRIPFGFLSDKYGVGKMMWISMFLVFLASLLRSFAVNYQILLLAQILLGIGLAATLPCLGKIVNMVFKEKAGIATGIYTTGFPIGDLFGLGGMIILLVLLNGNWRLIYLIFSAVTLFIALLWMAIGRVLQVNTSTAFCFNREHIKNLLKDSQLWIIIGVFICATGPFDTLMTWFPQLLTYYGYTIENAAILAMLYPLGFLFAGLSVGLASDRLGQVKPLIWLLFASAIITILGMIFTPLLFFPVLIFIIGFSLSGILTLGFILPTKQANFENYVGSAVGIITALGNIGSVFLPIIIGGLLDLTGSPVLPFVFIVGIVGIGFLLTFGVKEITITLER